MAYDRLVPIQAPTATFTVKAIATVSGGDLVEWASGTDNTGSSISTYGWGDVCVQKCATAAQCVGVALGTQTSGLEVAIAFNGVFSLPAGSGGVSGGNPVYAVGYGNMVDGVAGSAIGQAYRGIGVSLTKATALTGFALVRLNV